MARHYEKGTRVAHQRRFEVGQYELDRQPVRAATIVEANFSQPILNRKGKVASPVSVLVQFENSKGAEAVAPLDIIGTWEEYEKAEAARRAHAEKRAAKERESYEAQREIRRQKDIEAQEIAHKLTELGFEVPETSLPLHTERFENPYEYSGTATFSFTNEQMQVLVDLLGRRKPSE